MSGAARSTGWRRSLARPWLWAALVAAYAGAQRCWLGPAAGADHGCSCATTDLGGMQARTWRAGLDPSFPPFEMLDEAGNPVGYGRDLAWRIATWAGGRNRGVGLRQLARRGAGGKIRQHCFGPAL